MLTLRNLARNPARILVLVASLAIVLGAVPGSVQAQTPTSGDDVTSASDSSSTGKAASRVALVIGNSDYFETPVDGAASEARQFAEKLETLGFKVFLGENLSSYLTGRSIKRYAEDAESADVSLIYYKGHAIHLNSNFLVPVDVILKSRADRKKLIKLNSLLNAGSGAKAQLVILDSCRSSKMARGWGKALNRRFLCDSDTIGASRVSKNTMLVVPNGNPSVKTQIPYVDKFIELYQPEQSLPALIESIDESISLESAFTQNPFTLGKLPELAPLSQGLPDVKSAGEVIEILLEEDTVAPAEVETTTETAGECTEAQEGADVDESWKFVTSERNASAVNAFIKQYPCSVYAKEAEQLLADIESEEASEEELPKPADTEEIQTLAFTINTNPPDARVRILSIRDKYTAGIELERDKDYRIEVSLAGYDTIRRWVKLTEETQNLSIKLARQTARTRAPLSETEKQNFMTQLNQFEQRISITDTPWLARQLPNGQSKNVLLSLSDQYDSIEIEIISMTANANTGQMSAVLRLNKMIKQNGDIVDTVIPAPAYREFRITSSLQADGRRRLSM